MREYTSFANPQGREGSMRVSSWTNTWLSNPVRTPTVATRPRQSNLHGGRAWRPEEDDFLIRMRMKKMPHKQIGLRLNKTELACRLHYHQLTMQHRIPSKKQSTGPVRPTISRSSLEENMKPSSQRLPPPRIREASTNSLFDAEMAHSPVTLDSANDIIPTTDLDLPHLAIQQPRPTQSPRSTQSGHFSHYVDYYRLQEIYEANKKHFWEVIATNYGESLDATQLEACWIQKCISDYFDDTERNRGLSGSPHVRVHAKDEHIPLRRNTLRPIHTQPPYKDLDTTSASLQRGNSFPQRSSINLPPLNHTVSTKPRQSSLASDQSTIYTGCLQNRDTHDQNTLRQFRPSF